MAQPWDRSTATESAGFRDLPLSSKKMYAALGGAGGKKVTHRGSWGEKGEIKTNTGETHQITFSETFLVDLASPYHNNALLSL